MTAKFFLFGIISAVLTTDAYADEMYRPRPGEVYGPSTYCEWNRSGLPTAQQKICSNLDHKNGVYTADWRTIEALNGAVYKIDMNSISHSTDGGADIMVYAVEGDTYDPRNLKRFIFDCHGHFVDSDNMSATLYTAPRSVVGQIAAIACAGAKDIRFEGASNGAQLGLTATEYCAGFSPEACNRIRKVVEAKVRPAFCKPGFGIVGSGLTSEQLRICYVMTSPKFH